MGEGPCMAPVGHCWPFMPIEGLQLQNLAVKEAQKEGCRLLAASAMDGQVRNLTNGNW